MIIAAYIKQTGKPDCHIFFGLFAKSQKVPHFIPTLQVMSHHWSPLAQAAEGRKAATLSLAQMRPEADWRSLSSLAVAQ
jgi:hypothetical protein